MYVLNVCVILSNAGYFASASTASSDIDVILKMEKMQPVSPYLMRSKRDICVLIL